MIEYKENGVLLTNPETGETLFIEGHSQAEIDQAAAVMLAPSTEKYNEGQKALRAEAYRNETDVMGFKVLRGELELSVWVDAIDAIKQRFPYRE